MPTVVRNARAEEVLCPCTVGFVLPEGARADVLLEVGINGWRHERAEFAGSITAR